MPLGMKDRRERLRFLRRARLVPGASAGVALFAAVLVLIVSITLFALGCGNQASRNLLQHQWGVGWLLAHPGPPEEPFGYYSTAPESPHTCIATSLVPAKFQKE